MLWTFTASVSFSTPPVQTVSQIMKGRAGTALVLDVDSGRILDSYHIDVAARRTVSPGSTVKPFTLMALIDAGIVTESTSYICPRTVRIAGRTLDCSHPVVPGPIDAVRALAYSCNHFFVSAAQQLPSDTLYRTLSRAGFNSPTGKWSTEIAGTLQRPQSKDAVRLMSIGEDGIAVTPLALAEAYRMIAKGLRNPDPTSVEMRMIRSGLENAVSEGTAQAAASKHFRVAGKTGTSGGHAWFAGFAPSERPEIVVLVFLEHGRGGPDAAPLAARIFGSYSVLNERSAP